MIDMTIKLGQSTNSITNMYTTELHVCKQQRMPTANCLLHVSLNISNNLVGMYMKLHKHHTYIEFDGSICTCVFKDL